MSELGKFCCFVCPAFDQTLRRLDDECATCGRPYHFPLTQAPGEVGEYIVERALARGFYGATFVVRRKSGLNLARKVLKVIPAKVYGHFGKSFKEEVLQHASVAEGAEHVVGVEDMFDADVTFGDLSLLCHVAVLEFVDGEPLSRYLSGMLPLTAAEAAQIAADLFRMKEEFEQRLVNHNDLHASNIIMQKLPASRRRADGIEPGIKAMAIDLGSAAVDRRSGGNYLGDLHWIGRHIHAMADRLLESDDIGSDLANRIGLKLHGIAQGLAAATENQRTPSANDMIRMIREEYQRTAEPWRPWRNQPVLRTFGESYNAQTLEAWYVPQLLVDPEGAWLESVSAPGPLVMTGMRGCGKTMLLHSLQFHARAAVRPDETEADALERVSKDRYVGLFVSAQRLIPTDPSAERPSTEILFARILVAYAAAAARAMAHLRDLDPDALSFDAFDGLLAAVNEALAPVPDLGQVFTIEQLERSLNNLLATVSRNDSEFKLATNAATAFPMLADAIRRAALIWSDAQVLFLLDDVSTRYLDAQRIEDLVSALLFQNPQAAFKLTSEAQTIFLSLKSPGRVHPAASGRDFATFDLGAQVHARLKTRSGKSFVNDILSARAKLFSGHPGVDPAHVLGDVDLETIARSIAESQPKSRERKRLYHGLRALSGVCVGDIGTVIQVYQEIIAGSSRTLPIPAEKQHEVFQDFCTRHLYHLDRRQSDLKTVAMQFAEASHQLLVESGKSKRTGRIRQYTSLYVRVTSGDVATQMNRLRELVDAGIFVFTGGTARTKTHDSNPTQQFKLTYRKIFGLMNFIGLAERDRFELSGAELERYLSEPGAGRELLLRNLSKAPPDSGSDDDIDDEKDQPTRELRRVEESENMVPMRQIDWLESTTEPAALIPSSPIEISPPMLPQVTELKLDDLGARAVETLVVGLGFEERTETSFERLLDAAQPRRILAVRYEHDGHRLRMLRAIEQRGLSVEEIPYADLVHGVAPVPTGRALIDVTGLTKAALFGFVRSGLVANRSLLIACTSALQYYPLESELASVLKAYAANDRHSLLSALRDVLTGETGPYQSIPLLVSEAEGSRLRALSAFASPKHERLLHLFETREYDAVELLTDRAETSRAQVGEIAARVALENTPGGRLVSVDAGDLAELVALLGKRHQEWYLDRGLTYEIGLTGNKMQATAAAVISAAVPVNMVWYVAPETFDESRFTQGAGVTRCFDVQLASHHG